MITNEEQTLKIEQYYNRGILKKEIRSYEVSLWTLQDEFITVLKWSDAEQKGRIENPKMTLSTDGTENFEFSIPMYYRVYYDKDKDKNGKLIENPNWYTTRNGNLIESLRKIKVIFNKETNFKRVFEFVIINIQESHENGILNCNLKCENLAFHELGKIGYKVNLKPEDYENDYYDWTIGKRDTQPVENIDYWCHKAGLRQRDGTNDSSRQWYYSVQMNWLSFENGTARDSKTIYEETFTTAWNADLQPTNYLSYVEKERPVTIENSNLYNITQTLAETFGVFCRYEYEYDENQHITGRNIIFYNNFMTDNFSTMGITYPYNSSSISRSIDSTNLTTKLFVLDAKNSSDENSYSIMNAAPNASKEDYILNFDYLYKTGAINQEQYDEIKPYEIKMSEYNTKLIQLQNNLAAYQQQKPEIEAKKTMYERTIDLDTEQLTQNQELKNALDAKDGTEDGLIEITTNNPDTKVVNNGRIDLKNTNKGIQADTLEVYNSYNSATKVLSNQITSYTCHYDENGNLDELQNITVANGMNTVYLIYKYDPELYYDAVVKTWNAKLGNDTAQLATYTTLLEDLENKIEDAEEAIDELTNEDDGLMPAARAAFERLMGPALREGYWQPEEYANYGDVYSIQKSFTETGNINNDTGTDAITVWDTTLFPEEDKAYYEEGVNATPKNYICLNLTEVFGNNIPDNIESYSLVFNANYAAPNDEPTAIRNLAFYAVGSQIQVGFINSDSDRIPVLIFIGSKNLTTEQIAHMKDSTKGRARLSIVGTTNNLVNGNETSSTSIPNIAWITSNNNLQIVYPRIKFSSPNLKTDTSNLVIWYGTHLLEYVKDYYINTRNTLRDNNYYCEYFITIKPSVLFKYGFAQNLRINYVLSNACTAIYLDAKKVSIENAYPQVSYEVNINALNTDISQVLYNRLAQLVSINDTDLKLENVFGYISQITLDLDNVQNDSIEIKNYKNKFEDIFSTILAQTEAMKYNGQSYNSAAAGQVGLIPEGFTETLEKNKEALDTYLNEYYKTSPTVQGQLQELFTEAGQILASSAEGQNKMASLTINNASTLNGFVTNVQEELSSTVYSGENRPTDFKRGDIWFRYREEQDGSRTELGRYIAVANSSEVKGNVLVGENPSETAGFVRTYDGTLASITGAALDVDAVSGIVNIEAQNQISLRSGGLIYIAANDTVEILGNKQVNIGGTQINLCSLYERELDPTTGQYSFKIDPETHKKILHETTGINLIAGEYDDNFDEQTGEYVGEAAHVFIKPTQIEMGASELLLKAASKINLLVSQGAEENTSAILLDADRGIDISSGAGLRLYSGTAAPAIYVGPTHAIAFHKGDYWIQTTSISDHYNYSEENSQYYADIITNKTLYPDENNMNGIQIVKIWQASQNVDESLQNSTTNWNQVSGARTTAINLIQSQGASGATIELNKEHLILGYNEATFQNSSGSIIEFTKNDIVLGVGTTDRTLNVTGVNGGLIGAKFTKDSIGFAVTTNSITNAILMNGIGITLGSGVNVTETISNLNTAVATAIANGTVGSYVRITPSGVYIGSSGELYINTTNFLIDSKATGANSLFELRNSTDWYLKYSLSNGLQIKGQVTAIGFNGQFIADGSHFGLYNTSGNPILTLSGTELQVSNGYTFSAAGAITINSDNLIVNPNAGNNSNDVLFKAINGSKGITVKGNGDTTITGAITATELTAGSGNNNYLHYDSTNGLTVTGTINARELHVGTSSGDSLTYNSTGLSIGGNKLTFNGSDLVIKGNVYANNLYLGTGTTNVLNGNYIDAQWIKFNNGITVSQIGIDNNGKILLSSITNGDTLSTLTSLDMYDGKISLSALATSDNNGNVYSGSNFTLSHTGITISSSGGLSITAAGAFTVTAGNFQLDASGNCTIGNTSGNYLQYTTGTGGGLTVKGNITATSLTIVDSNGNDAAGNWIGTYIGSETIWAGVKTATGARNLVLDDTGISLTSGSATNMTLTNGGITMEAGLINLTGTSWLKLASGSSLITLNSSGIAISGANFSVATTPLTINSNPSSGGYVINSNDNFMVDADGGVYINKLYVTYTDPETNKTVNTNIPLSNFINAVSFGGAWAGDTFKVTCTLWGAINKYYGLTTSIALSSVTIDNMAYAPGYGDATVKLKLTIDGHQGSEQTLTLSSIADATTAYASAWNRALGMIGRNYDGEKTITIPSSDWSANGTTTTFDITKTYNAGWKANYDSWTWADIVNGNGGTTATVSLPGSSPSSGWASATLSLYASGNTVNLSWFGSIIASCTVASSSGGDNDSCFSAGTLVRLADNTTKPIEKLQLGDKVLSYDQKTQTYISSEVTATYAHKEASNIVDMYFSSGEIITATKDHPFLTTEGWKAIKPKYKDSKMSLLHEGDQLVTSHKKPIYLDKIVPRPDLEGITVYNCTIEKYHTYVVGNIVVHNSKEAEPIT